MSEQTATPFSAGATRFAGARIARVEDLRLLTGRGTYVGDVVRPGTLHAAFVRSPFARARINGIDTSAALALPGVHAVFTAADLNHEAGEAWFAQIGKDVPDNPRPPLADGEVRFVGDLVALVVADDRYLAEDGVALVKVNYEQLTPVVDHLTADQVDALVHEAYPDNIVGQMAGRPWDSIESSFGPGVVTVAEMIHQQAYVAAPIETRGIVAEWSPADGTMHIWAASQAPHDLRGFAARFLRLPENKVRVVARDTGGAFGQKINTHREDQVVLLAARKLPRALKYIEDRRENLVASSSRRESGLARFAFNADGTIAAASLDHLQDVGAYPLPWPVWVAVATSLIFPGPYRVPATSFTTKVVFTNTPGRTAYRGPWQFETVAREITLDIAARRLGLDPAELRRRNLLRQDELPRTNPNGMPYSAMTPLETYEAALTAIDYDGFRRMQAEALASGRYIGIGTSSYAEPTTPSIPHHGSEGATMRVEPSGTVNVYLAGGSAGNSLETTAVQLTADALGVDIAQVHTIQGDTALTPFGSGTGGSRSGSMIAGAVRETAKVLREKIVAIAAQLLEASPDDIEMVGGVASVKGTPSASVTLAKIANTAYFGTANLPAGMAPGLEASARYKAEADSIWSNASHVCTVEVDVETGDVSVLRYVVAEDCGPMINPNIVEGQIAGGVVQGIGGVLFEEFTWDADGNPLATNLVDYQLPTTTEVPTIEFVHMEGSPGPGPGGYKGVGEGGAIGAPPAVANAIADALAPLGVTITSLPLTPDRVLALIDEARSAS